MRKSFGIVPFGLLMVAAAACSGENGTGSAQQSSAASTGSATSGAPQNMIVLLRDQLPGMSSRSSLGARAAAVAAQHAPILAQLQSQRARAAHSFKLVNGFATTLSSSEADTLAARTDILAVVPDRMIKVPRRAARETNAATGQKPSETSPTAGLCNTLEPEALQLTNAAFLDTTTPQAQQVVDGNGALVTGKGVKVGIVADGLDTTIPGFTHTDGSPVFVDYQDFSGDPAGTPTAGARCSGTRARSPPRTRRTGKR